jgi:2-dehydro-3-deoxy-D-arabinonate dehydratase
MKVCRFRDSAERVCVGLLSENNLADEAAGGVVIDLTAAGVETLSGLLESDNPSALLAELAKERLPRHPLANVRLLAPIEHQEVWAAGVTYLRSRKARMGESEFSATAYDRVYDAPRPELFFKANPEKVVGPGEAVGIRADARWSVPEPELAFVLNSRGELAGFTIGNDMSSRDIEGENLLYLPQAKIYNRSCALGPYLALGVTEAEARAWTIQLSIERDGRSVFEGETSPAQIKRPFAELSQYLFRSQSFPGGAVLLTGTGIIPPDTFTLQPRDKVRITISGIGELENSVVVV